MLTRSASLGRCLVNCSQDEPFSIQNVQFLPVGITFPIEKFFIHQHVSCGLSGLSSRDPAIRRYRGPAFRRRTAGSCLFSNWNVNGEAIGRAVYAAIFRGKSARFWCLQRWRRTFSTQCRALHPIARVRESNRSHDRLRGYLYRRSD